jgi:hypothetical protein
MVHLEREGAVERRIRKLIAEFEVPIDASGMSQRASPYSPKVGMIQMLEGAPQCRGQARKSQHPGL